MPHGWRALQRPRLSPTPGGVQANHPGGPEALSSEAKGLLLGGLVQSDICQHLGQGTCVQRRSKLSCFRGRPRKGM